MAKLQCNCGNGMGDSNVPSKNKINVFMKCEVDNALTKNQNISLFDFETEEIEEKYEYWYCPICFRVHVVENKPLGKVIKRYALTQEKEVSFEEMIPFYVFTDTEIYEAEEKDFKLKLINFINSNENSHLYYLNNEKNKIYKNIDGKRCLIYAQE